MAADLVAVLGATGFVGAAVCASLESRGAEVRRIPAPRLPACTPNEALSPGFAREAVEELRGRLQGCHAVINAAGVGDAEGADVGNLMAANGALPGVIGRATAGNVRFVQVSSAAVQGRASTLDATDNVAPFSPYSESKSVGELAVRSCNPGAIIYRPPGVHGAQRTVTRSIARVAQSPVACVAAPGADPTAQSLVENVADAIAFLALVDATPPPVVAHPSEGLTTSQLMEHLGGKPPRQIPRRLARAVVATAYRLGRSSGPLMANARRLDMLWFGQAQAESWLTHNGWTPVASADRWRSLGAELRNLHKEQKET